MAIAVAACIAVMLAPSAAYADSAGYAGGANNVVLVRNTVDNSAAARDAVQIAHDPANTVANQNIASATSTNCTGCRTVAVAMQVIVVEGSPQVFVPANAAVASNGGCDTCTTLAFAFQYVIQTDRVSYLSAAAQQQLRVLRGEVATATQSNLSYLDLKVELESLFSQVVDTVNSGLVGTGAGAGVTSVQTRESALTA
jgi:hypothetical protein